MVHAYRDGSSRDNLSTGKSGVGPESSDIVVGIQQRAARRGTFERHHSSRHQVCKHDRYEADQVRCLTWPGETPRRS